MPGVLTVQGKHGKKHNAPCLSQFLKKGAHSKVHALFILAGKFGIGFRNISYNGPKNESNSPKNTIKATTCITGETG